MTDLTAIPSGSGFGQNLFGDRVTLKLMNRHHEDPPVFGYHVSLAQLPDQDSAAWQKDTEGLLTVLKTALNEQFGAAAEFKIVEAGKIDMEMSPYAKAFQGLKRFIHY